MYSLQDYESAFEREGEAAMIVVIRRLSSKHLELLPDLLTQTA